jgi:hypothetical protein
MHMFYDTNDGVPVVLEDYGHLRDCVIPCMFWPDWSESTTTVRLFIDDINVIWNISA